MGDSAAGYCCDQRSGGAFVDAEIAEIRKNLTVDLRLAVAGLGLGLGLAARVLVRAN
ncbi:MAG: hypothetical protein K9L88_12220 [Chromatiaceae bacterium]|nr:hypothetical protein [Chromatiaceae bacterium]